MGLSPRTPFLYGRGGGGGAGGEGGLHLKPETGARMFVKLERVEYMSDDSA